MAICSVSYLSWKKGGTYFIMALAGQGTNMSSGTISAPVFSQAAVSASGT